MKFTKMQGCGNDYVYVNGFEEKIADEKSTAIKVSNRHFGIGSDGMIIINPSEIADFEMKMYNADGTRSEMCGNGVRCVGKYVYDFGLTDKTDITVESMGAIKKLQLNVDDKDNKVKTIRVDMGAPIFKCSEVPFICDKEVAIKEPIEVLGETYETTCVSMGNPHSVVFIEQNVLDFPLETVGKAFESHSRFPQRVNAEFARVIDRKTIEMRVWERGTGETLACGTGSCATAVAAMLCGLVDNEVTIKLLGGDLKIEWSQKDGDSVYMTGPAETVFNGEIEV